MPLFQYSAVTVSGETVNGQFNAGDRAEVLEMIREKKYYPVLVSEVVQGKDVKSFSLFNKINAKDISVFCRQFYAMLNAGVPIVQCLDILRQQTERKPLKEIINDLYEDVQKGSTFSEAMRTHQDSFPEILVSMVEAGEMSGRLDSVMERMSVHFEKENRINTKVKGAMVYPVVLSIVAVGVVIFLLVAVMPTFIGMFESSGVKLPLPTRILLAISDVIRRFWYIILLVLGALIYIGRRALKSESGTYAFDNYKLHMPVVKGVMVKLISARFTRTMSSLMSSGIPLLQAIEITSRVVVNRVAAKGLMNVHEELRKGMDLAGPVRRMGLFPPMVDSMIRIGEESGTLDNILEKTANFYDEEAEAAIQKLVTLLEPMLIVFMGVVVGFIVISIALPMFDMAQTVQ